MQQTITNNPIAYKQLALKAEQENDYTAKAKWFELYVKNIPNPTAEEYNMAGCFLNEYYMKISGKTRDAVRSLSYFERASDMIPSNHLYAKNATIMAAKINDANRGKKFWDRLFNQGSLNNDDKYDYAAFCLKNKDFEGWRNYFKYRFAKETSPTRFPKISGRVWTGKEDLKDKILLVYYEQGFGDTFLMFGYMPILAKLAKKVIFIVQDNIAELFKDNPYGIEIHSNKEPNCQVSFNYYIPSMSIPIALELNESNISVGEGFIKLNKSEVEKYKLKNKLEDSKYKIGLSIRGSVTGDRTRDIPPEVLKILDKLQNVQLYNLTKDLDQDVYKKLKRNKVVDLAKDFNNFKDTALAIECMDLIITADNVLLNLAGGLGKKTYGLFNWANQFRWFDLTGENTVWLTSVKPFVNDEQNEWEPTFNKVYLEIKKEVKRKKYRQ